MDSPFAKFKVVELREQLAAKGLPTKGLKKELIERLEAANTNPVDNHVEVESTNVGETTEVVSGEEELEAQVVVKADPIDIVGEVVLDDQLHPENEQKEHTINEEHVELDYEEGQVSPSINDDEKVPSEHVVEEVEEASEHVVGESEQISESKQQEQSNVLPRNDYQEQKSSIVKISNLVRPFSLQDINSLLNQYGLVTTFWIDKRRTTAFAEYDSCEAAELCRFHLNGRVWPDGIGKELLVEASSVEFMNAAMNAPVITDPPVESIKDLKERKQSSPLDELFCKTTTRPHLYYLPYKKTTRQQLAK